MAIWVLDIKSTKTVLPTHSDNTCSLYQINPGSLGKGCLHNLTSSAYYIKSTQTRLPSLCDNISSLYLISPDKAVNKYWQHQFLISNQPGMCSERDSPLKRLYRPTHTKLARLAGSWQLVWAAGCELSLALVHAWRPAWPGETSETTLRVVPPHKTRPPDNTWVDWSVDASASGSAQVGPGGRHRWAARVQVGREPARQKAREGSPSHYTSLNQPR